MITGDARGNPIEGGNPGSPEGRGMHDPDGEFMGTLRAGTMYCGFIYKGQAFFVGHNSEERLHDIQNWIHRNKFINGHTPYFPDRKLDPKDYGYYGGFNPNYLFY